MLRHFLRAGPWPEKHENGCLPSILLFTSEAKGYFPLSSCPKQAKCHKRLPSFLLLRKKIIPLPPALPCPLVTMTSLILTIALHFHKDKASSGLLTQVHPSSLRKHAPTPTPVTLHWRQTGYPLPFQCDSKRISGSL